MAQDSFIEKKRDSKTRKGKRGATESTIAKKRLGNSASYGSICTYCSPYILKTIQHNINKKYYQDSINKYCKTHNEDYLI